jgi:hypothetical protein
MDGAPPRKVLRKVLLLSGELYIGIPKRLAAELQITRGQWLIVRSRGRRGFQAHHVGQEWLANAARRRGAGRPNSAVAPSGA